jgi:hypothetical protein
MPKDRGHPEDSREQGDRSLQSYTNL